MNITEQRIKEGKEAEAKATPGPWETRFLHRAFQSARKDPGLTFHNPSESDWPDAKFIALARNNFGPLLEAYQAEVRRLNWTCICEPIGAQKEELERPLISYDSRNRKRNSIRTRPRQAEIRQRDEGFPA